MSFNPFDRAPVDAVERMGLDAGLRQHMLRVFNLMGLGVGITGLTAWLIAASPSLFALFFTPQGPTLLGYIAVFSPLVFIFAFGAIAMRASAATLQGAFWLYCALMGISMASVFAYFTGESIARTFFVVAAMFGATSLWGYTSKADLSRMGSFMMMGLIGIVVASLVNIFLKSTALHFVASVIGVIVFTGLTAWDVQRIKQTYAEEIGHESNEKIAVFNALSLYLNFVNLFQTMLQFMGVRRE